MTLLERQEQYVNTLGELDSFDQYTYLMGLAMKRPELSGVPREEEYRFLGCQSNLWVSLEECSCTVRKQATENKR